MKRIMAMSVLMLVALSMQAESNTDEEFAELEDDLAEMETPLQYNNHYLRSGNSSFWFSSGYSASRVHPVISGLVIGYNGWGNVPFSVSPDTSALKLDGASFNLTLCLFPFLFYDLNSSVMLSSAVGFKWRSFKFADKCNILVEGEQGLEYSHFTDNGKKNKLKMTYLTVPLRLDLFPTNNWHIVAGVEGNLRLCSKVKAKSYDDEKFKKKGDYYMNPLSCDVIFGINYRGIGIMASKDLTPLFKDGKGPDVYPYSIGICLDFNYFDAGINILK